MPLLVLVTKESSKALKLADFAEFGMALAGVMYYMCQAHPYGGNLINYDVIIRDRNSFDDKST